MALRIDTTAATAESASWSPAGEMVFQVGIDHHNAAKIEVLARCDNSAPWIGLHSWIGRDAPFQRIAKMPQVKIVVRGNSAGLAIKIWDGE